MSTENGRKHLPPYVSYRTFINFINGLQQKVPARIDRSYWGDMLSGSTGAQVIAALRFLGLVDANGKPTEPLKALAAATGQSRPAVLRNITEECYRFAIEGDLDIHLNATYAQLMELFRKTFQITDDVNRKCLKFFISIAADAGVPLSPFITKKVRGANTATITKTNTIKYKQRNVRNIPIPQASYGNTSDSWYGIILAKYPEFDPSWPDEIKLKWFSGFDELLKRVWPRTSGS